MSTTKSWSGFYIATGICCLLYILNLLFTPVPLIPVLGADDGHFMQQAVHISRLDWLGPYDHLTLIKGPGYPAFLAIGRVLHLPFPIATAAIECASFAFLAFAVGRLANSPRLATVMLAALAAFPWMWSGPLLRVLRDGFYTSLLFLFLAFSMLAIWGGGKRQWVLAAAAGITAGWMSITREEMPWLWPTIAVLVVCFGFTERRNSRPLPTSAIVLLAGIFAFSVPPTSAATLNYLKYGAFLVTDFTEPNFRSALKALYSVETGERIPYLPASRSSRLAAYEQSPTFAVLREALDGNPATLAGWQRPGCDMYAGRFCSDYAGGWFMWAFRDAVAITGGYKSPQIAREFYRNMAAEINSACKGARLTCRYTPIAEIPPIAPGNLANVVTSAAQAVARLSLAAPLPLDLPNSEGPSDMIRTAASLLRVLFVSPKPPGNADPVVQRFQVEWPLQLVGTIQRHIREFYNFIWPIAAIVFSLILMASTIVSIKRSAIDPLIVVTWIFV